MRDAGGAYDELDVDGAVVTIERAGLTKGTDTPVQELLGPAGRIAFEVHDNDPAPGLAEERWAPDAACRWRNARIARL